MRTRIGQVQSMVALAIISALAGGVVPQRDAWAATPPVAAHATRLATRLWHVHLVKSEPAQNDTLRTAPTAIKLWFTEDPELAITSIKLSMPMGADTMRVALSPVHRDAPPRSPVVADIRGTLHPGTYTISWKTAATDGHPAAGTITFVLMTRSAAGE